jgi:cell division protein FtsA
MEGVVELAEEIFHMPVSIGKPKGVTGLTDIVKNPIYSTAVGLLLWGGRQRLAGGDGKVGKEGVSGVVDSIGAWLKRVTSN